MGTMELDGVRIGDDGRDASDRFPGKVSPKAAAPAIDMTEAAEGVVGMMIDARARRYRKQRSLLENIQPGLSVASPTALIARTDALIEQAERGEQPRFYGWGGENTMISLKAARRLGEWLVAEQAVAAE